MIASKERESLNIIETTSGEDTSTINGFKNVRGKEAMRNANNPLSRKADT